MVWGSWSFGNELLRGGLSLAGQVAVAYYQKGCLGSHSFFSYHGLSLVECYTATPVTSFSKCMRRSYLLEIGRDLLVEYLPNMHAALSLAPLGLVELACNPSPQRDAGKSEVQGHIGLYRRLKASVIY